VNKQNIGVLQGVVQGVSHMADKSKCPGSFLPLPSCLAFHCGDRLGLGFLVLRDSFRRRLDLYLPEGLGKLHKKYATPMSR